MGTLPSQALTILKLHCLHGPTVYCQTVPDRSETNQKLKSDQEGSTLSDCTRPIRDQSGPQVRPGGFYTVRLYQTDPRPIRNSSQTRRVLHCQTVPDRSETNQKLKSDHAGCTVSDRQTQRRLHLQSPRLNLTWWGCCALNQPSLPTPFYSVWPFQLYFIP